MYIYDICGNSIDVITVSDSVIRDAAWHPSLPLITATSWSGVVSILARKPLDSIHERCHGDANHVLDKYGQCWRARHLPDRSVRDTGSIIFVSGNTGDIDVSNRIMLSRVLSDIVQGRVSIVDDYDRTYMEVEVMDDDEDENEDDEMDDDDDDHDDNDEDNEDDEQQGGDDILE